MCVIYTLTSHPDYALIIAANRDEFLQRPSTYSAWHSFPSPLDVAAGQQSDKLPPSFPLPAPLGSNQPSDDHGILSGIDAHPSGGGTWIGMTASGAFAVLTNFTEPAPQPLPPDSAVETHRSRGALAREWLKQENGAQTSGAHRRLVDYLERAGKQRHEYPGFNLLLGAVTVDAEGKHATVIGYLTNRETSAENVERPQAVLQELAHGGKILDLRSRGDGQSHVSPDLCKVCGLSNSTLDDPWTKVLDGEVAIERVLQNATASSEYASAGTAWAHSTAEELFAVLRTARPITSRTDHQATICVQPIRLPVKQAAENAASAQSSGSPPLAWYATRLSTVLFVPRDPSRQSLWVERDVHVNEHEAEGADSKPVLLSTKRATVAQRMYEWHMSAPVANDAA